MAYGVRNADALAAVVAFFEARNGMLYGFRFKDWSDYKSCLPLGTLAGTDQPLGTTDGVTASFQLAKVYASGAGSYSRAIAKPVAGTVLVTSTVPTGPELVVDWNNPATTNWSNTGQTGAVNGATLAGFLSSYEVGQTGSGLRQKLAAAAVVAGTKYRVQGWFKAGTGTQARLNLRCQPGNLDSVISGPYASPAITNTAGGAVSNVVATDLGGGNWTWSMDVIIGAGFTGALVGIGNLTRLRGRSVRGMQLTGSAPFGKWGTQTLIAGLTQDGQVTPWVIKGAMEGKAFAACANTVLVPELQPETVLRRENDPPDHFPILDNFAIHHNTEARKAMREVGCWLLFLLEIPSCCRICFNMRWKRFNPLFFRVSGNKTGIHPCLRRGRHFV